MLRYVHGVGLLSRQPASCWVRITSQALKQTAESEYQVDPRKQQRVRGLLQLKRRQLSQGLYLIKKEIV